MSDPHDMPFSGSGERKDLMDCDECGKETPESDLILILPRFIGEVERLLCPKCCNELEPPK